jgi:competence protein ComEC
MTAPAPGRTVAGMTAPDMTAAGMTALGMTADETGRRAGPDLRLFPGALTAWALAWWATGTRGRPVLIAAGLLAAVLGVLVVFVIVAATRRRTSRLLAPVAVITLIAALGAAVLTVSGVRILRREHDPLTTAATSHTVGTFTGTVIGDPTRLRTKSAFGADRWLVRVSVHELAIRGRTLRSSAQLVVLGSPRWSTLVAGSHVRGTGRLESSQPGSAEVAVAFPRGSPTLIDSGNWVWRSAERLRVGLRQACVGLPSDAQGLLPALVVGDTSHLSQELRDDLQAAGLTHLTAVSGANVAILAAVVVAVIAAAGGGLRLRVGGTALAIVGFVVLARPEPSVLRAAVMGGLALVGLLLARRGAGLPMLAATTVLLLLVDPWLARSFGFVLSVLATAGLLLLVPLWVERVQRLPRSLAIALAVPVAAQLATGPVIVLLNPTVSLIAVPANLIVEIAVAPATIFGVAAAALSPIWPPGAHLLAFVGGLSTEWIALVAHRAAAVPGGSLPWLGGLAGAVLLAVVSVIGVVLSLRRAWLALGLCLAAVICCLTVPQWISVLVGRDGRPPADWVVAQCDIGQGSATLIRSGADRAVIVDTGPDPGLVDRCLRLARVKVLDLMVITHFHIDHAGGITGALKGRGAPLIMVSPFSQPSDQARRVAAAAASVGSRVVVAAVGMTGQSGTGAWAVHWRLLPPERAPVGGAEADGTEINNASVAVFFQVQGLRVMALGDVEPEAQRPLIRTITASLAGADARVGAGAGVGAGPGVGVGAGVGGPAMAPVDVVVVAHHGSARQEPGLYELLRPRIALIGVGLNNDYGHPAPSTITLMRRLGALTLRTDLQGLLVVAGRPSALRVVTAK